MAEQEKEGFSLNPQTVALVLLLVVGGSQFHWGLQSSRPATKDGVERTAVGDQEVPARLWQDPLAAALAYRAEHPRASDSAAGGAEATATAAAPATILPHSLAELGNQLQRHGKPEPGGDGAVIVLEAMISGGSYGEDAEDRLRSRYAIVSALEVAGYVPWDQEHVDYVELPWPRGERLEGVASGQIPPLDGPSGTNSPVKAPGSTLVVPFEWFVPNQLKVATSGHAVLVLWLNREAFEDHPAKRLAQVNHALRSQLAPKPPLSAGPAPTGTSPELQIKLLDPSLRAFLVEEFGKSGSNKRAGLQLPGELNGVQIYSSWATTARPLLQLGVDWLGRSSIAEALSRERGPTLQNVTCTDDQLVQALLDELALRGVHPENGTDGVVLLSEWDTYYGRALPLTFAAVVRCQMDFPHQTIDGSRLSQALQRLRTDPAAWPTNLLRFSYLRGLDGQAPGAAKERAGKSKTEGAESGSPTEKSAGETAARAEGGSQLDYLPRLSDRVAEIETRLERKSSDPVKIKAVGILGSDVYDKLLVLQALRPNFGDELFFTTDLDARLLHPKELKWTRNLIVASSFGLRLNHHLQRGIPPFRDTYQTGRYLACLAALGYTPTPTNLVARRFEIGRHGAYDFSPQSDTWTIHPKPADRSPGSALLSGNQLGWFGLATLMVIILGANFSSRIRRGLQLLFGRGSPRPLPGEPASPPLTPWERATARLPLLVPLGLVGLFAVLVYCDQKNPGGAPFLWTEGISIWPTETIRLAAGCLAFHFLFRARADLLENARRMRRQFGLAAAGEWTVRQMWRDRGPGRNRIHQWEIVGQDGAALCADYDRLGSAAHRWYRTLWPASICYLLLGFGIFFLFEPPFRPFRGSLSSAVDYGMLALCSVLLILLIFYVVDAALLCRRFIELVSQTEVHWPPGVCQHFRDEAGFSGEDLNDYISFRLIAFRSEAVGRLIYYPFLILFLVVAARSSYWAHWDWPPSMILIISLNALYAVYAVTSLRRAAEAARATFLDRLRVRLIRAMGRRDQMQLVRQIRELVKDVEERTDGAFAPISQQPVIKAVLMPFGGAGILSLLQYLAEKS